MTGGQNQRIRVVVRGDGSGTTFLLANHLEAVCDGNCGPQWNRGVGTCVTWPNPFFYEADGNEGLNQVVAANNYTIGYSTPELTRPAVSTITALKTFTARDGNGANSLTVNAGTYQARPRASLENRAGNFVLATPASGINALTSATPPTGAAAANAANWGVRGLVPDPTARNAYPIPGFTWYNGYTCYANNQVGIGLRQFWSWYTQSTNSQLRNILAADQFGGLPANWHAAVRNLVATGRNTKISGVTEPAANRNPTCTGLSGAS